MDPVTEEEKKSLDRAEKRGRIQASIICGIVSAIFIVVFVLTHRSNLGW
jgi:hypothetical protein